MAQGGNGAARRDGDLLDCIEEARAAVAREERPEAERALYRLERLLVERLADERAQAAAVADANARAVELLDRQNEIAEELRRQNGELVRQQALIERTRREIEEQARATADANVEAVLKLDEAEARIRALDRAREELLAASREIADRSDSLQSEAMALATANVEAVLLMDEKESAIEALQARTQEMERVKKDLEEKAFMDPMTGLFNHRYFSRQIGLEIARAGRYGRALTIVFLDIDHFKKINDTHGHLAGDEVLRTIGGLIQGAVRGSDILVRMGATPTAARYGGEEFVIILPETPVDGGVAIAERIRVKLEGADIPCGRTQPLGRVTLSGGVAELSQGEGAEALIKRADDALYRAKASGRNRIEIAGEGGN